MSLSKADSNNIKCIKAIGIPRHKKTTATRIKSAVVLLLKLKAEYLKQNNQKNYSASVFLALLRPPNAPKRLLKLATRPSLEVLRCSPV